MLGEFNKVCEQQIYGLEIFVLIFIFSGGNVFIIFRDENRVGKGKGGGEV